MSDFATEYQRVQGNISDSYDECQSKGATMPQVQNSENLASTIASIPSGSSNTQTGTFIVASDSTYFTIAYPANKVVAFAEITANQDDLDALADKTGYGVYNSLSCNEKMVEMEVYGRKLTRFNEGAYYSNNTNLSRFSTNGGGFSWQQMYDSSTQGQFYCALGNRNLIAGIRYTYTLYFK